MVNTDHAYHTTARNASTESIQTIAPEVNPQIERQASRDVYPEASGQQDPEHKVEHTNISTKEQVEMDENAVHDKVPDGGFGWFVLIGVFIAQFMTYGISSSWGVMQDYYQQNVFGNDYPNIVVLLSLTGTLSLVFTNGCASLVQILISYVGVTWSMTIGSLLLSMGLIFAGFSTQVWHLYLTQGILFGLGSSICYVTSMGVVPQYFERKRGLAMGIVTSGTGVGGLIVPFIMDAINQSLGGAWTYRILGFICLASNVVTVLLVRERVPRSLKTKKKFSDIIQFEILKDVNFDIWCVIACLQVMGYFLPYFYLPSYATHLGLSASDGTAIVSVTSAANIVGRILAGIVADRIGHLSTNIIFTFISALSAFLIWTFAYSYGVLMAFGVVFGLVGGSYSPLISPITASVIGMEKLATGFSLTLLFTVIALWSPMISSAIEDSVDPEPFLTYKMYTGVTFLLASLTGLLLKLKMKRNLFVKF